MENFLQSNLTLGLGYQCLYLNVGKSIVCLLVASEPQRVAGWSLSVSVGGSGSILSQVHSPHCLVLIDPVLSWNLHNCNMISRVRLSLTSVIRLGYLPPALFCVLYPVSVVHATF